MPNPPTIRVLPVLPAFLKTITTATTGVIIVSDPGANKDRNILMVRFTNNDTKEHLVSIWKRGQGTGDITDDKLVFGKQHAIDAKSPIEVGPILLAPGQELAAAITTTPEDAANDDKVNYEPEVWESDFTP